jgi:FtsP/CotA-like multicopper oxidase with cupredoxin domain
VTITHPVVDSQGNPINGVTRTPAIAEAVVDPVTGRVTAINVTNGGSYEGEPIVTIAPPPDPAGTTATAFAVTFVTPNLPDNSMGMETFMDTPVVNGTVYPYLEVDPQAYRFRILNAANDRFWNLQLHEATSIISSITVTEGGSGYTRPPSVVITDAGGTGAGAVATSTIDPVTGAVTGVDLLVVGSGYTNPTVTFVGGGGIGATATANVYSDPTEVGMVPFTGFQPDGNLWPEGWPTPDWRDGGIPDPRNLGPEMIQIGTEGGFLPTPVVFDNTPIGWDRDPKSATLGNVLEHNLFMGCAERADIIVDFSQYAGKTLIVYNDAPAAVPARDPRYDYYSVNGDETETGGSVPTLPGYGPNTRTIMQIRVKPADPLNPPQPYDLAALQDAFTTTADHESVFVQSQEPIIVPQADYNSAYGLSGVGADTFPSLTMAYERIQDLSLTFRPLDLTTPAVADLAPNAVTIENQNKAIIEEWNTDWGRMEGFLGVEMKYTNSTNQTSLWFRMQDPVTEIMTDTGDVMTFLDAAPDGTEIWKVTHNGVDTHPIHFHLFNVQVINRVDWGGVVKPPEPNELGWKETLRMNPLEDCIVAMRPSVPKLEFGVPDSVRLLDPAMPEGSTMGFVPFDGNGNPTTTVNEYYNFGWEYMWHCHILSHEEMDMMRPIQVNVARELATAPVLDAVFDGAQIGLTWTDATPVGDPNTLGNPKNEVGFRIERSPLDAGGQPGVYLPIGTAPANSTGFIDDTFDPLLSHAYRVVVFNAAGEAMSNVQIVDLIAPTVTIDQAAGQADPTGAGPILFTVVFSEEVTGFDATDVILSGSALPTTAVVSTTDNIAFAVEVSGMSQDGTVVASVGAGAANDLAGNPSEASTSTDNSVSIARILEGTPGDDVFQFIADPSGSWTARVNGVKYSFGPESKAVVFNGGYDVARLWGSLGNDTCKGDPSNVNLYGLGYYIRAGYFDEVHANAVSGTDDRAYLFDSDAADALFARADSDPNLARVTFGGAGNKIEVALFDYVKADGSKGGGNTKDRLDPLNFLLDDINWL